MKRVADEEKKWNDQLKLQEHQISLMEEKQRSDKEKEHAKVTQLKTYGDALRNSVTKMTNEPIDLLLFFDQIERQFLDLKVPDDLKVMLIKPFLNDRARYLISQVASTRAADYVHVKTYLLQQLRLVPQAMLDMFNTITRHENETYKAFVSRLVILLDQYLISRKVKDLQDIKDLLISDRIKCSLSEQPLSHLLRAESTKEDFARPDFICDLLDNYLATHDKDDKPIASALSMLAPITKRANQVKPAQPFQQVFYHSTGNKAKESPKGITVGKVAEVTWRCFKCNAPSHVFKNCPQRELFTGNSGQ